MSRKREDERTKLTANWLNTVSAAAVTIGVIAPIATIIVSFPTPLFDLGNPIVGIAIWLATGLGLHSGARYILSGLSDYED
jgi:hypothetical protein